VNSNNKYTAEFFYFLYANQIDNNNFDHQKKKINSQDVAENKLSNLQARHCNFCVKKPSNEKDETTGPNAIESST
jgi:hypothetical protein